MQIQSTVVALSGACISYIIYSVLCRIVISRRNAAKKRELKCEDAPVQKYKLPLGIDEVHRSLKADAEMQFLVYIMERFQEIGALTYQASFMGTKSYFTADEKNIQAMLATQFNDFDLGPVRRGNFFPLLGNGIFTQDGKAWQHSRAMMRPQFAREQVSDLELEECHVQNLMCALPVAQDGWTGQVDLQTLFFRLTLDSATEFLFGKSVDSQINELPGIVRTASSDSSQDEKVFARAFDEGQRTLAMRIRFKDKYWLVRPKKFFEDCQACHDFIDHFVRMALSKDPKDKLPQNNERYIFLEALAAETRDPIELRSQLLNILLAGRDTTASLLGWLFYSLARDPVRYAKLRQVVLENFGTYENPSGITFEALKSCKYLQHCMNEALRLYPVVPLNFRCANKDTTLPRGGGPDGKSKIFIPKGTQVDYSVHVMHHRADIWGPDVEEFKPERWEGRKFGWEFLPVSSV